MPLASAGSLMKARINEKTRIILVLILILLVCIALPASISNYYANLQDGITVSSSEEQILVYTAGELHITRSALCYVREDSDGINTLRLPVPSGCLSDVSYVSDNVKNITVEHELQRDFIVLEFTRTYLPSEQFSIALSYVLNEQYVADMSKNACAFSYSAGDFYGAYVNSLTVYWNDSETINSDSHTAENGKLIWSVCPGRDTLNINVSYPLEIFDSSVYIKALSDMATQSVRPYYTLAWCVGVAVLVIALVFLLVLYKRRKLYMSGRGFLLSED